MTLEEEIGALRQQRNAVILAHNYTRPEIQDIADFVGDSLELSRKAAECHAPVIVFCGVRFMAADPDAVAAYRKEHPEALIVAYVNTTAATKTEVDLCCTSGNAEKLIASLPPEQKILFLPDANLGSNLNAKLNRHMELWPGYCPTHNRIMPEHILAAKERHPNALVLVHPECLPAVVKLADQALSTGGMLKYVRESACREFIIGTECGILHRMQKENPDKTFYPLEPAVVCPNMKKITLEDVLFCLRDMTPEIELPEDVCRSAKAPIDRMLEALP